MCRKCNSWINDIVEPDFCSFQKLQIFTGDNVQFFINLSRVAVDELTIIFLCKIESKPCFTCCSLTGYNIERVHSGGIIFSKFAASKRLVYKYITSNGPKPPGVSV